MTDWVLRHMHAVIVTDALLHAVILALCIFVLLWSFKFALMVKNHPNANRSAINLAYLMPVIAAIMTFFSISSASYCVRHYATWWK